MAKPRGPHKIKAKGSEPPRKSGLPQLKTWRIKRGLTVAALAEKAGLSAGTVSGIENGTQSFSDDSLTRLARALGVPAGYLKDVPPELAERIELAELIWPIWSKATEDQRRLILKLASDVVHIK